jgi:hypothetical protein
VVTYDEPGHRVKVAGLGTAVVCSSYSV